MNRGELLALIEAEHVQLNEDNEAFEIAEEEYGQVESEWSDMEYEFERLTEKKEELEEVRDAKQQAIEDTQDRIDTLQEQLEEMTKLRLVILDWEGTALVTFTEDECVYFTQALNDSIKVADLNGNETRKRFIEALKAKFIAPFPL